MQPQTRKQMIQKIHIGKNELKLDDNAYKMLLLEAVDKPGCSMMTESELMTVLQTMKAKGFVVKSKKYGKRPTASKTAPNRQGLMNKIGALLYQSKKPWDYAHAIAKRSFSIERVQWLTDDQLHKLVQMLASYNHRHGMSVK